MASKRRKASAQPSASERRLVTASLQAGETIAQQAMQFRAKQQRARAEREAELERLPRRRRQITAAARAPIPARTRRRLGARATSGVLIAEGDSWFDYPFHDVVRILEDDHLFDVESVAHKGDRVEDMAHAAGQFEELARRLEKLLRDNKVPRAILLSGGGNDIAGDAFTFLLNHAQSGLPALNDDIVRGVIDVRLRAAYMTIIAGITAIARKYLDRPIPIITHGYDYALPDGRGFLGGFWFLPGPWLEPGFREKRHLNFNGNKDVIVNLIDRFNAMLVQVSRYRDFGHVHHLDLRGTLKHGANYKTDWANELHPTGSGFELVAARFAELIARVG